MRVTIFLRDARGSLVESRDVEAAEGVLMAEEFVRCQLGSDNMGGSVTWERIDTEAP